MTLLNADSDLQDRKTWLNIFSVSLDRIYSSFFHLLIPDPEAYRNEFKRDHDLQTQGTAATSGFIEIHADPGIPISSVLSQSQFVLDLTGSTFGAPGGNQWVHLLEPDMWVRVARVSPNIFAPTVSLDYIPKTFKGAGIQIQVGWHLDKIRSYNWDLYELWDLRNIVDIDNGLDPTREMRLIGPRCIQNPLERVWYSSPYEVVWKDSYAPPFFPTPIPLPQPAVAGMLAIRPHGLAIDVLVGIPPTQTSNSVINGPWKQDHNVYVFNGKKWIKKEVVHGKNLLPDYLDSESADPNFKYYFRPFRNGYRTLQNNMDYRTLNSITI